MSETPAGLSPRLDERERRINTDYEWVLHDPEVQRRYAGQVIAVHNHTVCGQGKTHLAALQDALSRPGSPPQGELTAVFVEGCVVPPRAR